MENRILVVVDMQKDFIDGVLGTAQAQAIVERVAQKIAAFDGEVVYTRDTHEQNYMETQEGKHLPVPHCIKGSAGWQIDSRISRLMTDNTKIFDKPTFGSTALSAYLKEKQNIKDITLIGLCTDICVISNAMLIKANLPEVPVYVDEACCAGVTIESHKNALEAMKMCQIDIVSDINAPNASIW